jgi:small subunit ribosomal protein S16
MAVHIRLQRHGSHKRPFYHVVATDHRSARNGRFLEKLGFYDPQTTPTTVELKAERMQFWFERGALLSGTVTHLVKIKELQLSRTISEK